MNLSAQEINAQILMLSEQEQLEIVDFILSQQKKYVRKRLKPISETALLSEAALATDWNRPEEDEAWEAQQTEGEKLLAVLKKTGFLGSLPDAPDLSVNYKEHLDWSDKI
jgi:hypothetical protein